jgi:hypothetical protein
MIKLIFRILPKNHKIMSLVFYLKTIGKNVDPSATITFPKTDWRFDHWIFVNRNFCMKILKRTLPPYSLFSLPLRRNEALFPFSFNEGACAPHVIFFFFFLKTEGHLALQSWNGWIMYWPYDLSNERPCGPCISSYYYFFLIPFYLLFFYFYFLFLL